MTTSANRALVLEAFDTLFNRRDYEAAARVWSPNYIQHSAHIPPGRDGLFNLTKALPAELRYENAVAVAEGEYVFLHGRFSNHGRPRAWIVADIVRVVDGILVEHWDVIQDEATREESKSGRPMFGDRFTDYGSQHELTVEPARRITAPLYEALNQPQTKDVSALLAQACHPDYQSYSTNDEWLSRETLAGVFKQIGASVPDLAWSVKEIIGPLRATMQISSRRGHRHADRRVLGRAPDGKGIQDHRRRRLHDPGRQARQVLPRRKLDRRVAADEVVRRPATSKRSP